VCLYVGVDDTKALSGRWVMNIFTRGLLIPFLYCAGYVRLRCGWDGIASAAFRS